MSKELIFVTLLLICATVALGAEDQGTMRLFGCSILPGESIPVRHTCDGVDLSPPLLWADPPEGTVGYALLCEDPDAPGGLWVHWVLYDLPVGQRCIKEQARTGGDYCRDDSHVQHRRQRRDGQDGEGWDTVDLVGAVDAHLARVDERVGQTEHGGSQDGKDSHPRDDVLPERGIDLGHNEAHHQVKAQRKQIVQQEQVLRANDHFERTARRSDRGCDRQPGQLWKQCAACLHPRHLSDKPKVV